MSEFKQWQVTLKPLAGKPEFQRLRVQDGLTVFHYFECVPCKRDLGPMEYPRDNNLPVTCSGCKASLTLVMVPVS